MNSVRTYPIGALLLMGAMAGTAADAPATKPRKASEFGPLAKTPATKMDGSIRGTQPLPQGPELSMMFLHRETSGTEKVHEKLADFQVVQEGAAAAIAGRRVIAEMMW